MDLRETGDVKKRWQEYTEDLYRKDLNDPNNRDSLTRISESSDKTSLARSKMGWNPERRNR